GAASAAEITPVEPELVRTSGGMSRMTNIALSTASADALTKLRAHTPLVQVITNRVVTGFTANVLLALGAAGAMVDIPVEAGPFARQASGLLVNLGTPGSEQRLAMHEA